MLQDDVSEPMCPILTGVPLDHMTRSVRSGDVIGRNRGAITNGPRCFDSATVFLEPRDAAVAVFVDRESAFAIQRQPVRAGLAVLGDVDARAPALRPKDGQAIVVRPAIDRSPVFRKVKDRSTLRTVIDRTPRLTYTAGLRGSDSRQAQLRRRDRWVRNELREGNS